MRPRPRSSASSAIWGYRIWWHLPGLYSPQNHRGVRQNIFPTHYVSINMICVRDDHVIVTELQEVGEDTERPKL